MPNLTVSVPQNVLDAAEARLGRRGRSQLRKYLKNSVFALAESDRPLDQATIEELRAGRRSPSIIADDRYWRSVIARVKSRASNDRKKRSA